MLTRCLRVFVTKFLFLLLSINSAYGSNSYNKIFLHKVAYSEKYDMHTRKLFPWYHTWGIEHQIIHRASQPVWYPGEFWFPGSDTQRNYSFPGFKPRDSWFLGYYTVINYGLLGIILWEIMVPWFLHTLENRRVPHRTKWSNFYFFGLSFRWYYHKLRYLVMFKKYCKFKFFSLFFFHS